MKNFTRIVFSLFFLWFSLHGVENGNFVDVG